MLKVMADNRVEISAKQDGALYNVALDEKDFIIEGLGNEFSMSHVGLVVFVESGEAILHGRHITSEDTEQITLPANSSGYLVLRIDLTQAVGNEAFLYATPTLSNEEINWDGSIYDMPIATFITSNVDITNFEDARVMHTTLYPHKLSDLTDDINVLSKSELKTISHNAIYRGADITSMYDNGTFHANVANGTFENIYLGDYIIKNGRKYVVASCDEFYGYNNYAMIGTHHCAMICVSGLPNSYMNASNTNTGGYQASYMHTTHLPSCLATIASDLGDSNLLAHQKLLDTGDSWSWVANQKIALLSENQVYGGQVWGRTPYSVGEAYNKLPIFNLKRPNAVFGNIYPWLRDSWSSPGFATLDNRGRADNDHASISRYVCPLILLK